ncbi:MULTISPECIES: amino acid ABC transporter permease [unclassified Fusibacter]|uniref:amino acid ABC transporter permease n=1 Tax=unclassified Fusibacter TaxID=2624464 RepID=UPI001013147D|nr:MULTISPECIES: amino acid ABC transporter permease [unclassified Fusibacter]MCK8061586.1 amino acid ABC transporter permease [Fusibacter sp. A2]NPE23769.1 amino acid ABC transporter permease [Fusibacter sp. A1]RXV58675.1 amino acid ABC transporter permease [Fusibacter sp. A1]
MNEAFQLKAFISVIPKLIAALPITLAIASVAMLFGLLLGTVIGILRFKNRGVLTLPLAAYVSFFRGTPLMVQLFIFYYGLPQLIPGLASLSAVQAAILVMSINASAYISEVVRAALSSVPIGQFHASSAVGMTSWQTLTHVILPQAYRIAIPALGNTFISIIQGTSITFMLGVRDIMGTAKMNAAANYRFLETYLAVGLIYWSLTIVLSKINSHLEDHFSKGYKRK